MTEPKGAAGIEEMAEKMLQGVAENWGWFMALGIALIILGTVAIVSPYIATVAAGLFFGWLLLIGGVVQIVHAFFTKTWGGFFLDLLIGILYAVGGFLMVTNLLAGIVTLTLLLIAVFIANGILEIIMAFQLRPAKGWGWVLTGGIVSILVGLMIWAKLPSSAVWAIGLLVGIRMIFSGWSFVALALAGKSAREGGEAAAA